MLYSIYGFLAGDVPRVNGQLAVARAFGDQSLKAHLSSEPDIRHVPINSSIEFVILASDGLWKVCILFANFTLTLSPYTVQNLLPSINTFFLDINPKSFFLLRYCPLVYIYLFYSERPEKILSQKNCNFLRPI